MEEMMVVRPMARLVMALAKGSLTSWVFLREIYPEYRYLETMHD